MFEFGPQVSRSGVADVRFYFGVVRSNFRRLLVEGGGGFVHSVGLEPEFSPESDLVIGLAFVLLRRFVVIPTHGRFVLSVGLDAELSAEAFGVI